MLGGDEMETMKRVARDAFNGCFGKVAAKIAALVGSPWAFGLAVGAIVVWAALGPRYRYSDTWQLIINTGTTIVTFLMVFLIQNTQNRDARAIHLKLDEVIRAIGSAHNELIDIEKLSDAELEQLAKRYEVVRRETDNRRRSKRPKSA
jgi:low affinity Fe/Cu permease